MALLFIVTDALAEIQSGHNIIRRIQPTRNARDKANNKRSTTTKENNKKPIEFGEVRKRNFLLLEGFSSARYWHEQMSGDG